MAKAANDTEWGVNTFLFNTETYPYGILSCYGLAAKAQIDDVQLRQLFPTRDEALADGVEKARLRAEAQQAFNTEFPFLNDDLSSRMALVTDMDEAETVLSEHLTAVSKKKKLAELAATLKAVEQKPCPLYNEMLALLGKANEAQTAGG